MRSRHRLRPLLIGVAALSVVALAIVLADVAYIGAGLRAAAAVDGTRSGLALRAPVTIERDARDVPHIRAQNEHDLFFAQGYAVGSDRLFQIDLLRHLVYGRLTEWFGASALATDERSRVVDLRRIVQRQYARTEPRQLDALRAFAAGVNAAREREPLPVEYRILHLRPQPWNAQDSLAVGFATVLDLIDAWDDIQMREGVANRSPVASPELYAITDPAYDSPIAPAHVAKLPALPVITPPLARQTDSPFTLASSEEHQRSGSNEWAVGAARSRTGHALLASDPHLRITMPGVWYLVDLQAPGYHVAGVSLPGTPGVILGHNDRIAWGATNGTVCTESVYESDRTSAAHLLRPARRERFLVRFATTVERDYLLGAHGFASEPGSEPRAFVDWVSERDPVTPLLAFDLLDRARSARDARSALQRYTGPPQNFIVADADGEAGYQLAGPVPRDPLWCLRVHPSGDPSYPLLPFAALPHVRASRDALLYTANNRTYGAGFAYRLSPAFAPPYRAARIAQLLAAGSKFSVEDFERFQLDTLSLPELELVRATHAAALRAGRHSRSVRELAEFDGHFDSGSQPAVLAQALRVSARERFARLLTGEGYRAYISSAGGADLSLLLRVLRERPRGWIADPDRFLLDALDDARPRVISPSDRQRNWGTVNAVQPRHPFANLGLHWLDGASLAGSGDAYSIRVQSQPNHGQSYRAVWDVGAWDRGGIAIPSGESGEPGSHHYVDLTNDWNAGTLEPLPYSNDAVARATKQRLTLTP